MECFVQRIAGNDWRLKNVGVENLTIDSEYDTTNPKDENHAWEGVYINKVKDGWVRMVNFCHLAGSAVVTQRDASRITVEDCISQAHLPLYGRTMSVPALLFRTGHARFCGWSLCSGS